jgi:Pyruvate/2-oxoacid:ferredoxin oxidoreductase delta subunit
MMRAIVEIDESKCDGCGQCIPACAEGAIELEGGKARLVSDVLCDGLGACLGECPRGAIRMTDRVAANFDERVVAQRSEGRRSPPHAPRRPLLSVVQAPTVAHGGCPGSQSRSFAAHAPPREPRQSCEGAPATELSHWPVKLELVSPRAPWLGGCDLLVAADCVPFAYAAFHRDFLAGRRVLVACPKLDDVSGYLEKLAEIFRLASPRSVTVVKMEVPCCFGIAAAAKEALRRCGREVPYQESTIGVQGSRVS